MQDSGLHSAGTVSVTVGQSDDHDGHRTNSRQGLKNIEKDF